MDKGKITRFLLILMIFLQIPSIMVNAVEINYSKKIYDKKIMLNNDVSLSGVFASYSWNFEVKDNVKVDTLSLKLLVEVTDVLAKNPGSYITFSLNGIQFYSQPINSNNGNVQEININIPKDNLRKGYNEFKIDGYLRLSDLACVDDYNTANWMVLKKGSFIQLNQSNKIPDNRINEMPYPMVNDGGFEKTKIIIPEDYTDSELTSAFRFNMIMGKYNTECEIIKANEIDKAKKSNLVYIGRKDKIPESIKLVQDIKSDIDKNGYIKIANSPIGESKEERILYIVSNNGEELESAIKFLANEELTSQVAQDYIVVNSKRELDVKIEEEKNKLTFKELGYNQKEVQGSFRSEVSIAYMLPYNRILGAGDKIHLNMRYSENLDFDRSLFSVYVNDIPAGSKKLEKEKANGDVVDIIIPKDVINSNYLDIKFTFDLLLDDINCEVNQFEQPWAIITDDSYMEANSKQISQYYFKTYPAPFVSDWDINNVAIVVPDNLSSNEIKGLGNMMTFMGKSIKYNWGNLDVISNKNLKDQYSNKNIIVYGTPENNALIKKLNKDFWMKYNDDYSGFLSNEKLTLLEESFAKRITTFQLDVSPFNAQKNMLVITSPNAEILEKSLVFLSDEKEFYKLNGDGAVIDEFGDVRNFKYKEEKEIQGYDKLKGMNDNSKLLLLLMIIFVSFTIISSILYVYKHNGKKGRRKGK